MRVLILAGTGMLGHRVYRQLTQSTHEIKVAVRKTRDEMSAFSWFKTQHLIPSVELTDFKNLKRTLDEQSPQVIINCSGVTTRKLKSYGASEVVQINSSLPWFLNEWCEEHGSRLIHISTDCVFSGKGAPYNENSLTDATDLYGRSKALGEVQNSKNTVTLRTSIIGPELATHSELYEWFLAQNGKDVHGYKNVIYSGVTTLVLARVIERMINEFPRLSGIYQIASSPISKYDLLCLIRDTHQLNITVHAETLTVSNKTLSSERFFNATGVTIPSWTEMIRELNQVYNHPTKIGQARLV